MTPALILVTFSLYTLFIFLISWWTSRKADNESFFIGNRKSPWPMRFSVGCDVYLRSGLGGQHTFYLFCHCAGLCSRLCRGKYRFAACLLQTQPDLYLYIPRPALWPGILQNRLLVFSAFANYRCLVSYVSGNKCSATFCL